MSATLPAALVDHPDPFVRHQVDPGRVRGVWVRDGATAVASDAHLPGGAGTVLTLLGEPPALAELAASLAGEIEIPWRVTVPVAAVGALPSTWQHRHRRQWHWMLSSVEPPPIEHRVVEVADPGEIDDLLDAGNPDAHARPGSPGVACWLGIRDAHGRLLAVGALARQHDGTGHLRAVTVRPSMRGRGLGWSLSAELTRRALAGASGIATLGVYADNDPAVTIYTELGYSVVHTFASGPVTGFSMTTAVVPSR